MTEVRALDPTEPLADGRTVIEASAGTGKTFTIAAQVARLVAEDGIPIERILVVTFTRAATAELHGRIRDRLVMSHRALTGDHPADEADPHMEVLLSVDAETRERSIERLRNAVVRFDRAQIFTIHGLAVRVLGHLGFHSRMSTELEPVATDTELVSQVVSDLIVDKFADDATDIVKVDDLSKIAKAITTTLDAEIVPNPDETTGRPRARAALAIVARIELARRLRAGGKAGFDQFLVEARDALNEPEIGDHARTVMSSRYSVALVDESQDTDPIQWQIINAMFQDARLVIIGDPKQSIYSFRGADIESYLESVEQADAHWTLATNWRSDKPLVTALDALLDGVTFGDDRIEYQRVEAAEVHGASRIVGDAVPLTIRRFDGGMDIERRTRGNTGFKTPETRKVVADDTVAEIVKLLHSNTEIETDDGPRPIAPRDIAVLCRTRVQLNMVRDRLAAAGVPSVASSSGSVFKTEAGEEWRRFLLGVERPDRPSMVLFAASGLLVGMDLAAIADLDGDTVELQDRMRHWADLLGTRGIPALLADLSANTGLVERILGTDGGERLMTDINHIAEAMHTAMGERTIGSMLGWLEDAMQDADKEARAETAEARERRLETDADAVQVLTIHGAKGLEFPIVFCPFLWDKWSPPRGFIPVFHVSANGDDTRRRFVDVGGKGSPGYDSHRKAAMAESDAEESRLLYVALTRARHRQVVWWIDQAADAEKTKLHQILSSGRPEDAEPHDLSRLEAKSGGTIELQTVAEKPTIEPYEPPEQKRPALSLARFDRSIDYNWRRASFTSLSPDHPIAAGHDTGEYPDREDETVEVDFDDVTLAHVPLPMAGLPKGAAFGTLVHSIFEELNFDDDDLAAAVRTEVDGGVRRGAWDLDKGALADGILASIETPLGPAADDLRLRDLSKSDVLDEMRFEFPVRAAHGVMTLGDIAAVLRNHLPDDDPFRIYADTLDELPETRFRGYLTGAIDLTAAIAREGEAKRYVAIDYKTNTLPMRGEEPAAADYAIGPMRRAMHESHYLLQSLIYQVALHRYLQVRLPGYDPELHLGGSMYLFVRGMIGPETPVIDGERCGVFRWNPPPQMIVDLSRRFASKETA